MLLFAGNSNIGLAKEISNKSGIKLGISEIKRFSDSETIVRIKEKIRNEKVFLIQSTNNPVNENLMELLIMADACLNNGAKVIYAIIPYYGYARQDRITENGEPITTKLIAKLIKIAGIKGIITMDIHSKETEKVFKRLKIHFKNLSFIERVTSYLKDLEKNFVVVAPDKGALKRANSLAKRCNFELCYIEKERDKAESISKMELKGNVKGRDCLLIDDIISTGGTLINAAELLKKSGANEIIIVATHGIFTNNALERINNSIISKVIISDTIEQKTASDKLTVLSVAKIFANAIKEF